MSTDAIHKNFKDQALRPESSDWQPEQHIIDIGQYIFDNFTQDQIKQSKFLDVCCGKGRVSGFLRQHFPAHYAGIDFVEESLKVALTKSRIDEAIEANLALPNADLNIQSANFAFSNRSALFFNVEELTNMLANVRKHLKKGRWYKKGGTFICQHFIDRAQTKEENRQNATFLDENPQFRHLETYESLAAIYRSAGFKIDEAKTQGSLIALDVPRSLILIYARN